MERLTAEDRLMLWPDERWPQDIGALAILDGSSLLDPGGRFRIEGVRQAIEARLHLVPRFRQVLHVPRRGLGGPLWVDAPVFDIADHVGVIALPAPGDEAQLLLAAEQLRRRRLDRARLLWEMWFLTGLPERRVGLFVRMHHATADGIAGVATMSTFLDATNCRHSGMVDLRAIGHPGRRYTGDRRSPSPPGRITPDTRVIITQSLGRKAAMITRVSPRYAYLRGLRNHPRGHTA